LGGKNPIKLNDGTERKFINDNDTVIMKGFCQNGQVRIGFGEVSSKLLPLCQEIIDILIKVPFATANGTFYFVNTNAVNRQTLSTF
jgi:hypothetical protein